MSDIFHEVDEDVRRDKAADLWKRYQTPIFVVAFLIVAATGAWDYYQTNRTKAAEAANARYEAASALARDGKAQEAVTAFDAIAADGPQGYASLARLRAAEERVGVDKAKAIADLKAMAEDKNIDKVTQQVALLRSALLVMEEGDRQKMELALGPLMTAAGAFRYSAQEWSALDALENGDFDEAERVFNLLLSDREAPQSMRQRAAAYRGLLNAKRGASKPEGAGAAGGGVSGGAISVTPVIEPANEGEAPSGPPPLETQKK